MRKKIKQNILQLLGTIYNGLEALPSLSGNVQLTILSDVQEGIGCIRKLVEESREEVSGPLAELAALEERLSQLRLGKREVDQKESKDLCKRLEQVKNDLEQALNAKLEILFMPYKASMWDSMESVYREAKKAQDCNVTVMPVPYYNIGRERAVLGTVYEGDCFPADVEITDYKQYHLPEQQPDVIFIHNPYDNMNYVTQLPECYFSSELVKHTDHLVYIPYKVCGGIVADHYCLTPGVQNAWRVYVQGESVGAIYRKYNPAEKIVVAGSPKVDKVVEFEKNKPPVPEEWKEAFEGRTVFLLNTHLNSIINEAQNLIDRLNEMIQILSERDDIAILWRPHPLSMETIYSMKPSVAAAYSEVVERFKKLHNSVYDETSNMNRAIALSDAYIGSRSSLTTLYGITGKPVMLLNMNMRLGMRSLAQRNQDSLRVVDGAADGESLYLAARDVNQVFQYSLSSPQPEPLKNLEIPFNERIVRILKDKNRLIMITWGRRAKCHIYDLKEASSRQVRLPESASERDSEYAKWKTRLYMMSGNMKHFGYLDLEKERYVEISLAGKINTNQGAKIASIQASGDSIYILPEQSDVIYRFKCLSRQWEKIRIGREEQHLLAMAADRTKLYATLESGELLVYDIVGKETTEICENLDAKNLKILAGDGAVFLASEKDLSLMQVDEASHTVRNTQMPDDLMADTDLFPKNKVFSSWEFAEGQLFIYSDALNQLLKVSIKENRAEGVKLKWDVDMESYLPTHFSGVSKRSLYYESVCGLNSYINQSVEGKDILAKSRIAEFNEVFADIQGNAGKRIWASVKGSI